MSVARLFVERLPQAGESLRLGAAEASHARARRLSAGDEVVLFDGSGREAVARVVRAARSGIELAAGRPREAEAAGFPIALYASAVRAERLAWIAEKATELGLSRLILVRTDRTQAFRAGATLAGRLERVARAAAKQCGAARWPEIEGPFPLSEAFASESATHRILLDAAGEHFPGGLAPGAAALAVGPEGGWTSREMDLARGLGWTPARLPAGRLRTETAAIAGLVLLRAALGASA